MPRDLSPRQPPTLAVAENATAPVGKLGAEIWSTTANKKLVWTGTKWSDSTSTRKIAAQVNDNFVVTNESVVVVIATKNVNITLPRSDDYVGDYITIKHISNSPFITTISSSSIIESWTEHFFERVEEGLEPLTLSQKFASVTLVSTGLGWAITARYL